MVEQRDFLERMKEASGASFEREGLNPKLEKIYDLIELLKKKLNAHFRNSKHLGLNKTLSKQAEDELDMSGLNLDTSIRDTIRKVEKVVKEAEKKVDFVSLEVLKKEEEEKAELERLNREKETQVQKEAELESLRREKEAQAQKEAELERLRREKEAQEKREAEIKAKREEEDRRRMLQEIERIKAEEMARIRAEDEKRKEMLKKQELELRRLKDEMDAKIKKENEVNQIQNEKIMGLIETMQRQKLEQTKLNIEILKEQFEFITCQFKLIKNEVSQLNKSSSKRKVMK